MNKSDKPILYLKFQLSNDSSTRSWTPIIYQQFPTKF